MGVRELPDGSRMKMIAAKLCLAAKSWQTWAIFAAVSPEISSLVKAFFAASPRW